MASGDSSLTSLDGVTSLYRRFRPGRFAELRGQDHIVRALQGAVTTGRVNHAYLFSGPRGTGKTTTARILAKALNCENPVDGDACNVCVSCVAITKGSSLDVTELDAASNNGVDDIRDITAGAWHGTPGRWKVYIFDEVHQLSKAASAALLKTLEEPPAHVVFVLATTDPHKVLATIRSRTQHLEFRLLPGDTLSHLLQDVREAAGLGADDTVIDTAVRLGRGSARDALSALDQLLATGAGEDARPDFDGLFAALADQDAVQALTTLASLAQDGWDPEQLAESFAGDLRQCFLLQVAPEASDAAGTERERLSQWGSRLGLARTVRTLETVGKSLREMKSAPDKMVLLEVALVRLVRPELDASLEALEERVTRLERNPVAAPAPAAPAAPAPRRPIGATAPAAAPAPAPTPAPATPAPTAAPAPTPPAPSRPAPVAPTPAAPAASPPSSAAEFRERFEQRVVPRTSRGAQMVLQSARFVDFADNRLTLAVASEEVRTSTERIAQGLRGALEHEFRVPIQVSWIVDGTIAAMAPAPSFAPAPRAARPTQADVEAYDEQEEDAGDAIVVNSVSEHLITEMFPGAEEIS